MSVFVKICGLASGGDVAAVAALRPDAMGFVFWEKSKRAVNVKDVAEWTRGLPAEILRVGVFVDASPDEMARAVAEAGLDVVQLHGGQAADFPRVGKTAGVFSKVWKVVHLDRGGPGPGEAAQVDAYLLDSYSEQSPGGTGKTCDWAAARAFVEGAGKPVLLAGGLTPGNVAEAIRQVGPWGVDVSTGVEERAGKKDLERVRAFIGACRSE